MELYVQILSKFKNAVIDDDVDSCKVSFALMNYVNNSLNCETVKEYQQNAYEIFGNVNLICLACKSSAIKVLQHLLSNENRACSLPYLTKKSNLLPEEDDEERHNAIYYAIRSNKTGIPEILFGKWLDDYFEENSDRLDDLLSRALKDLKTRNVYISEDMKMYMKSKLVELRFFNETSQKKNTGKLNDIQNLKDLTILRIDFVLESITYLIKQFRNLEPNEEFLLSSNYIAKNIFILKSSVVCKVKLPWEEIEFCLIIFIRSCQNRFQKYPLYHFVLNKDRLLMHLDTFSQILIEIKDKVRCVNKSKNGKLLIDKINGIEKIVDLKELYDDFAQIRDLYSLEKIKNSIDLAMSANITKKCDQLSIVRALQVIGECMKNSDDSPNLSVDTYELLLSSLPDNIKEVIAQLRNSLSHAESLSLRSEIETSGQNFFKSIQSDITNMNFTIIGVIRTKKTMIMGNLLSKLKCCKDIDTMKLFLRQNHMFANSLQKELEEAQSLNVNSIEQLEKLVLELEREIRNDLNCAMELLRRIQDIVQSARGENTSDCSLECFKSDIPTDPEEIRQIFKDLSLLTSISQEIEIESLKKLETVNMPEDIAKIRKFLAHIASINELKTAKYFFRKIGYYSNLSNVSALLSLIERKIEARPIKEDDLKECERLIANFEKEIGSKASRLKEMFIKVHSLIQCEKTNLKYDQNDFQKILSWLRTLIQSGDEEYSNSFVTIMIDFQEKFEPLGLLTNFDKFLYEINIIFQSITSELRRGNFPKDLRLRESLSDILIFLEFHIGKIRWIKEFKQMLQSHKKQKLLNFSKKVPELGDQLKNMLSLKLSLLEKISNVCHENKLFFEKSECSQKKLKLLSAIEMLTLDLMTILGCLPNRLAHNAFFLDSDYPIINGKNLRNHLAHGNALLSIVLGDDRTDILLNAEKMRTHDLLTRERQIGKKIKNDPQRLKDCFEGDLSAVREQQRLFVALTEGKLETVEDCLSKGADMFGTDFRSQTSLHFAAKGPCFKMVKFVLQYNLDVSAVDINLQSALHVASFNGRLNVVEYLIQELNVSINRRDTDGRTPLHLASINGHTSVVKFLLEHQAEMASKDRLGNSALHYAVIHNHADVVGILLGKEQIAAANKTFLGLTILHLASENGHIELIVPLLEKMDVNIKSDLHYVPLHYAAKGGRADVVQFLVTNGAEINAKTLNGTTPLHLAAEKGHYAVVEKLLWHGADINAVDSDGWTALSFAVTEGYLAISRLLLEKGAFADRTRNSFDSPINLAARFGHHELVEMLRQKCDTASTISALHWAAYMGHLNIVEQLVNNEINIECDDNGYTALHLAAFHGHTDVVNFLISKGYDVNAKIGRNIFEQNFTDEDEDNCDTAVDIGGFNDASQLLPILEQESDEAALHPSSLRKPQDMNNVESDGSGYTALHLTTHKGHTDVVNFLISKGYDINAKGDMDKLQNNPIFDDQDNRRIALSFLERGNLNDLAQLFSILKIGPGQTALHLSSVPEYKDTVRSLLKNQANIYIKDETGITALQLIIREGMADILVDEKVPVNFADYDNYSPLQLGAAKGDLLFVKYCVQNGCDTSVRSKKTDLSALDVAVVNGHEEVVQYLIECGADVNAVSRDGTTALKLAVQENRKNVVNMLINNNAEISTEKEREFLLSAVTSGHEDMVEYFLTRNPENGDPGTKCLEFPLHTAVLLGHLNIVKRLLELQTRKDINARNEVFSTPLEIASRKGYCEIARLLLSNGADPNFSDDFPPLHFAVEMGDSEMVKILIKAGANSTLQMAGCSAIELAVINKNLDIMETLLELSKIYINYKGRNGHTLLHHAAVSGSIQIVKSLVDKGAAINGRDSTDAKPIHIAAKEGYQDIVEYFLIEGLDIDDRGENGWSLMHYAAAGNQSEICKFLIKNGLSANIVDSHGCTPLHVAAQMGKTNVLHTLLHYGAYYDFCNKSDETPCDVSMISNIHIRASFSFILSLFSAVKKNELPKVEALLNEGLRISKFGYANIKSVVNTSLLHYASWNGYEKIVDLLLKCNADPNIRSANGCTPLHYAAKFSHPRIVKALLRSGSMFDAECKYKKTPKDYATDRDVIELLDSMQEIRNNENFISGTVIGLGDLENAKTAIGVENTCGKTKIIPEKGFDTLDDEDPSVMDFEEAMSETLIEQEKYDEAQSLIENIYRNRKEILGDCNEKTLSAMTLMASVFCLQGKTKEAISIFEEALNKMRNVFGSDHAQTFQTQILITQLMCEEELENGNIAKALNLNLEILENLNKFPVITDFILQLKIKVAEVLLNLRKPGDALDVYKDVSEIQQDIYGLHHPGTSYTLSQIVETLSVMEEEERKRFIEKDPVFKRKLKIYKNIDKKRKLKIGPAPPRNQERSPKITD
ncbi:Ankyrin-1 [Araneus ventricosus]|uniref:Ankyrin-1 n=1 Tax=Araneus ventricosus TaxID=182803 RepID=A0A4Y2KW13_ARAVE|nr:Ankyrin-1 [Araneus ventricosus]